MLLAVDIGNSALKLAFYDHDKLVNFIIREFTNFVPSVLAEYKLTEAVITSVVPEKTKIISKVLLDNFNLTPYIINTNSKLNLKIDYENPDKLGIDRICSAEGALKEFEKSQEKYNESRNILVVDFGTATTLNFIKFDKVFCGGIILPGFELMVKALNIHTAQLPQIKVADYHSLIGRDTKSAIASGIINSTVSLIEKSYEHLRNEGVTNVSIYVTGGNYYFFGEHLGINHIYIEDLVLRGAKIIYERNKVGQP